MDSLKVLTLLVKKNFSAVFFLQLAPCRRVRWRTEAVNVRLHFRGFHRLIAVSAWPGLPLSAGFPPPLAPTLRPAVLRTLDPPPHPWTRRRPRAPRAGRSGTVRDVTRPRLNQTRRLGNFKLKGGAVRALGSGGGRASAPVL